MKTSEKAIELIKNFESFSSKVYKCKGGKWTIGYGHVVNKVVPNITKEEAEELLKNDISKAENAINSLVRVKLTQNQFDALVSLVFNWGASNFADSIGLLKLNAGDYKEAAIEFFSKEKGVVKAGGKFLNGLYARRQKEEKLLWLC